MNKPASGYEFVKTVFKTHNKTNDVVETLLHYSKGSECEWLEFKASMVIQHTDEKGRDPNGDTQDSLYWNYTREIIALMNSTGGAFIIGIDDATKLPIDLSTSTNDPHHKFSNQEKYFREEVKSRIYPKVGKIWKDKNGYPWQIEQNSPIDPRLEVVKYKDKIGVLYDVILILVPPVQTPILATRYSKDGFKNKVLFKRARGAVGEAEQIRDPDDLAITQYTQHRELYSTEFSQFIAEIDAEPSRATIVLAKIEKYKATLQKATVSANEYIDLTNSAIIDETESEEDEPDLGIRYYNDYDDDETGQTSLGEGQNTHQAEASTSATYITESAPSSLDQLLATYSRVCITGEPGAGKSTALKKLAITLCKTSPSPSIGVLIPMGQWINGGAAISEIIHLTTGLSDIELSTLTASGSIHIIFDALNECPASARDSAIRSIKAYMATHPNVPVVISSRSTLDLAIFKLPIFIIQQLNESQQLEFITKRIADSRRAEEIQIQLSKNPGGDTMLGNPMILNLVCKVYKKNGSIPNGRAQLYKIIIDDWLKTQLTKYKQLHNQEFPVTKEAILQSLAYASFRARASNEHIGTIPVEFAKEELGYHCDAIINLICTPPLLPRDDSAIHFSHETYQEYLCAEALLRNPDIVSSIGTFDIDTWGMPIAYLSEICITSNIDYPRSILTKVRDANLWLWLALTISFDSDSSNDQSQTIPAAYVFDRNNRISHPDICRSLILSMSARRKWYPEQTASLRYILASSKRAFEIWNAFESDVFELLFNNRRYVINLWPKSRIRVLKSFIATDIGKLCSSNNEIWCKYITQSSPETAAVIVSAGLESYPALPVITRSRIQKLKDKVTTANVKILSACGAVSDVEAERILAEIPDNPHLSRLLAPLVSDPANLGIRLYQVLVALPDDILKYLHEKWSSFTPSPTTQHTWMQLILDAFPKTHVWVRKIGMLMHAGFLQPEVAHDFVQEHIRDLNCKIARSCIRNGFDILEFFPREVQERVRAKIKKDIKKHPDKHIKATKKQEIVSSKFSTKLLSQPEGLLNAYTQLAGKRITFTVCSSNPSGRGCVMFESPEFDRPLSSPLKEMIVGEKYSAYVDIFAFPKGDGNFLFQIKNPRPLSQHPNPTSTTTLHNKPSEDNSMQKRNDSTQSILLSKFETFFAEKSFQKGNNTLPLNSNSVSIYIDETWPGIQDEDFKNTGVIGGIVWTGPVDYNKLRHIQTHLRREGSEPLKHLLKCRSAFPFVFPISFPKDFNPNENKYLSLVEDALMVLIGWILPKPSCETSLSIYLEHFGKFGDNHDGTAHFQTILDTIKKQQREDRFGNYKINTVKWVPKDFEYVPYGDLVSYLCAQTPGARQMAREFDLKNWDGYLPFEESVLTTLRELDAPTPNAFMDALLSFTEICRGSNLFTSIVQNALHRAKDDQSFCNTYLTRIEQSYTDKSHSLTTLNALAEPFLNKFHDESFRKNPCLLLKRHLINLQKANHNGDPESIDAESAAYQEARKRAIRLAPDLVVHSDLNLAVHFHDLFQFHRGADIVEQWLTEPCFEYLPLSSQGKLFSSLGQSMAMSGKTSEADTYFSSAIERFSQESYACATELEQTSIYRATNMLTSDTTQATSIFETIVGYSIAETCSNLKCINDKPFTEHLLVKLLYASSNTPEYVPLIKSYLKNCRPFNIKTDVQHPWELILFYRVLLAYTINEKDRSLRLNELSRVYAKLTQRHQMGATLKLIKAFTDIACYLICNISPDKTRLFECTSSIKSASPELNSTAERLIKIYENKDRASVQELWETLPFNYK